MTTVQIERIGEIRISKDDTGRIFGQIFEATREGGIDYVPSYLSTPMNPTGINLLRFVGKGYTVIDPQHLVTCPGCGALMDYGAMECDACEQQFRDYLDEKWTQSKLIGGMR